MIATKNRPTTTFGAAIAENYTKAVGRLASEKIAERLGGIYTLERISKESPHDYCTVMETPLRRGMNGLALQLQQALQRDPFAGDLYVLRGKRGDLLRLWQSRRIRPHRLTDRFERLGVA